MRAAKLFEQGYSKAEVARRCRVSNQSAGRWHTAWAAGGHQARQHPGRAGRKPRLQPLDRVPLAADLQSGPEKTRGHATALWTLPRVVALIAQRFGHRYSTAQASRLLRQMGWSCQKPARRALERDEQAIRVWKQRRWPAIKKARWPRRTIVFLDESGLSQRPYVLRTWAPRGQTPLLRHPGGWKKLSAAAGVTRRGFYFRLYPGSIQARPLIHFLGHLQRQVHGNILRVWDRLGVHRSRGVRNWLAAQAGRFGVEELPAYAPELNPVEYLWGWRKPNTVANGCARTEAELHWLARQAQRRKATLVSAFWKQADLRF